MAKALIQLSNFRPVSTQIKSLQIVSTDTNGFSDLFYFGGSSIVDLYIPGSNSGTAWVAADLAVYVCLANGTQGNTSDYAPLYKDDGTQYIIKVPSVPATGLFIQVNPYDFVGIDAIQFQSVNTAAPGTPVVQTNSPSVTIITIGNGTF